DESEVNMLLAVAAVSALAAEARLTTPTAARPNVHLLNFIWFLQCKFGYLYTFCALLTNSQTGANTVCPGTNPVHLTFFYGISMGLTTSFFNFLQRPSGSTTKTDDDLHLFCRERRSRLV